MSAQPVAKALFHDRDDANAAVQRLLDAHVPASDIEMRTGGGRLVPVRHRNHMAETALMGTVVGAGMAMLWLGVGAGGIVELPVMDRIVDSVGLVGAGLRLGFLGAAAGLVAGALGGVRTRVEAVDEQRVLDEARGIVVHLEQDNPAALRALQASEPDRLMLLTDS